MRPIVSTLAAFALVAGIPATPAAADSFTAGAHFEVGGVHFNLGYRDHGDHRRGYRDYFFRTRHRLAYSGYKCSDACYRDRDLDYHHHTCPVVTHHLRRSRLHLGDVLARWAPGWRDDHHRHGYGYRDHPSYGHDDHRRGYRSRGEYRRYGEYRRPHRDRHHDRRGHRHDRSCGHHH